MHSLDVSYLLVTVWVWWFDSQGFDPAPQRGGRNTPSREAALAVPAVRLNLSVPDARVNACKSQKCNFPMLMWVKSCLSGCEKHVDQPPGKRSLMSVAVKRQILAPPEETTTGKLKQVYPEVFKLQKVSQWVRVWVCAFGWSPLFCFASSFPFLGHSLAGRNQGPLSAARHQHASLLVPPAAFRKRIFGIGAELSPLFTLYLPTPQSLVTHVSV